MPPSGPLYGRFSGFGEPLLRVATGRLWAVIAGAAEFFGGLFLALGLLSRPAAAIAVLMGVALFHVHLGNGFFGTEGGFEYPLFWGLAAVSFVLRGGGRLSLDVLTGRARRAL